MEQPRVPVGSCARDRGGPGRWPSRGSADPEGGGECRSRSGWSRMHELAKKPHKGAKLEDTLTFFHQLSTLVSSGTPLLQALKIADRAVREHQASRRSSSRSRPRWQPGAPSTRPRPPSPHLRVPVDRGDPHRRGHRQDGRGPGRAQQADPRFPRDQAQGQGLAHVPDDPDRRRGDRRDGHALDGRADVRQDVQGHGRQAPRHHPVRRRRLGLHRPVRPLRRDRASWRRSSASSGS